MPTNTIAIGYEKLQLISTITGDPLFCNWQSDGSTASFYEDGACRVEDSTNDYQAVCEATGNSVVLNFTIKTPLRQNVNFEVVCAIPIPVVETIVIQVQGITIFFLPFPFFSFEKAFKYYGLQQNYLLWVKHKYSTKCR